MTGEVWIISGPTASGKTALAVELARRVDCSILSFDSRQFYKEIPIGTAAPTLEEKGGVPHFFIGSHSIHHPLDAATFASEAMPIIHAEMARSQRILLVGGSGLYLHALLYGFDAIPDVPETMRIALQQEFEQFGLAPLQSELQQKDPTYFQEVDIQNTHRVLRALEVIRFTGKPFSSFRTGKSQVFPYPIKWVNLEWPREVLYQRINQRVHTMLAQGWMEEAKTVFPYKQLSPLQTVGYKELFAFLEGQTPWAQTIELIAQNTRRYAKRQITWFKRYPEVQHLSADVELVYSYLMDL